MHTQPLQVPSAAVAVMAEHARRAAPEECCGLLIGSILARRVTEAWAVKNVARAPQHAFCLAPADLLAAELRARAAGLDVVGVYHSHPRHDAAPSAGDAAGAVPSWFYLIMGNGPGRADVTRVWRMPNEGGVFAEEVWVAV